MVSIIDETGDKLVFEFKNSIPIELADLTKSLNAVANQYRRFIIREALHEESETKFFVKEVRSGSTIVELNRLYKQITSRFWERLQTLKQFWQPQRQ